VSFQVGFGVYSNPTSSYKAHWTVRVTGTQLDDGTFDITYEHSLGDHLNPSLSESSPWTWYERSQVNVRFK
jgi:hypothetical protein